MTHVPAEVAKNSKSATENNRLKIQYIDHIVLMIKETKRTESFYSKFLGKSREKDKYSIAWKIGKTKVFFALPYKQIKSNNFNKDRIGLDHIAFGVRTLEELEKFKKLLTKSRIKHSGIKSDKFGNKKYIWFDDPDKIRLEFYYRPK